MPLLTLTIDKSNYTIECEEGEETLLREAEKIINKKISELGETSSLTKTKKFLMISLLLASELSSKQKKTESSIQLEKIEKELEILEGLIGKGFNVKKRN